MDLLDQAIYDTVHGSALGAPAIATRLGMNHQVLLNKANPQNDTHKLSVRESLAIQLMTGNHRISSAMNTLLENEAKPSPFDCVLKCALAVSKEHGDVVRSLHEALEDGRFTMREKEATCIEIDELIDALQQLKQTVAEHESDKNLKAVG